MDLLSLAYYAIICAILSFFAPSLGSMTARLSVGAAVGIGSAAILPYIRELF